MLLQKKSTNLFGREENDNDEKIASLIALYEKCKLA